MLEDWPSSSDVDIICKVAGLFICASTIIKFIASKYHTPAERLALITSLPESTTHERKSGINLLYTQVLEQAFCDVDPDEQELYSDFRAIVGAVVLLFNPLPVKTFSTLLGVADTPTTLLCSLHSVLKFPESRADPIGFSTNHSLTSSWTQDAARIKDSM